MFSQGNVPFMYCRPRGLNSLWVSSRTVATMRRCSSVSLNRNESSALMMASSGGPCRANGPIRCHSRQACEKGDELRRGDHGRRRVGRRLLAMHEAVLGVGIILPDRGRGALAAASPSARRRSPRWRRDRGRAARRARGSGCRRRARSRPAPGWGSRGLSIEG